MTGVGPLIRKDLLIVARQRRWFAARGATVGLLLLITLPFFIALATTNATKSPGQVAPIVAGMFIFFAWAQFFLALLAAPAFGALTLGDARNRVAVDLLRLASINRPALASAKLVGAAAWPLLLAIAAIPFLALWSLWGGVIAVNLLAIVTLTAATAVGFVALGLLTGSLARGEGSSLILAYLIAIGYLISVPMLHSVIPADVRVMIHTPTALHALLSTGPHADKWPISILTTLGFTLLCTVATAATMFLGDAAARLRGRHGGRRRSRTVWGLPLMWRELQVGLRTREARVVMVGWVLALGLVLFYFFVPAPNDVKEVAIIIAYAPLPALVFAVLGSMAIASEKESQTIGSLILTPAGPLGIVSGKFVGVVIRGLPMFLPPLFHALLQDDLKWVFGLLSSSLVCIYLGAFGLLCSVIFKKTVTAVLGMLGGLVLQTVCTCNIVTMLVAGLPALLMDIAEKGLSMEQGVLLMLATAAYVGIVLANLGIAVGLFENQVRKVL